ncbi:MAG TPA: Wzz/FepE/Etk N-terminal domain-containing protein [Prolixibacteraceae bacterium]|nr:Wzz/FepE/Etk N-terminal domain-containing protein [Prolixibacteraceae bacterium]
MENFFNNERMIRALWKWKIHILIVTFLAIVFSVIISSPLFMKPKFKSTGKLYPVNMQVYSEESESEQLLENIRSNDIKFRLIDAFQLDKVYKIDRNDPLYKTYILGEFDENISFKKTEFETVEIKVLDENPQRASDMVDSLILYYNQHLQKQHAIKYLEVAEIALHDLKIKNQEIDSLKQLLVQLSREHSLLNYPSQVEAATVGLMDAAARKGDTKPARELLDNLKEKGIEFQVVEHQLTEFQRVADSLKVQHDWGMSHGTKKITYGIVVESPFPADKKAYPVRWLIVFLSTLAAFAASVVCVLLIDYFRGRSTAQ